MCPRIVTGEITDEEKQEIESAKSRVLVESNLKCFRATNGIRPGEFSVVVGKQGNGKSAFCKTIMFESVINKVNCYALLSEEKSSVYKHSLAKAFSNFKGQDSNEYLSKMYFDSMLDWDSHEKNVNFMLGYLEEQIQRYQIDVLIFDNFTTSFLDSLPISKQGDVIDAFRLIASEHDIAIVGVFHTLKGTDIYKKITDGEDVRGNQSSTNAGSYNYILSTYFRSDPPKAVLAIDKARYHPEANKTFWQLNYNHELGVYTSDSQTTYEEVNAIVAEINIKSRDRIKQITGGKSW